MTDKLVVHLGFVNVPYNKETRQAPMRAAKKYGAMKRKSFRKQKSSEVVANILEEKYGIVNLFSEKYDEEIKQFFSEVLRKVFIESVSQRGKFASDRMVQYMRPRTSQIDKIFRSFLDRQETGIFIKKAAEGIRTGRKSRAPRPAFIDTGIYRASFKSWADIE